MLNQKGFSSLIVVAILALLGIGFYAGATSQKSIISNVSELLKNPEPSVVPTSKPDASVGAVNQTEPYNAQKPYTSTSDSNKVTFNGVYYIGDFDKTRFTITFPKKGGDIKGDVTGACTGTITGNLEAPDQAGDGKITGNLDGSCKPVPRFSFKVGVKVAYEGMVHLNSGKIDVVYITTEPYSSRGYFNMYFNPYPSATNIQISTPLPTPMPTSTQSSTNTSDPNAPTFIKVSSPNGGESFKVGDTIHVTWSSNNLYKSGSCIITLAYDNGSKSSAWVPVNTPNGYFDWKLTSESGGRQVKVDMDCYDSNSNNTHDQSDNYFTVTN